METANVTAGAGFAAGGVHRDFRSLRPIAVRVHRYLGLATAAFLAVVGLTGSLLVFDEELDAAFNPQLMQGDGGAVSAEELLAARDQLAARLPKASINYLPLHVESGCTAQFWVMDTAAETADDEYFVDPKTGSVRGSRRWGDLSQGVTNLMPFIYKLHYSLALGEAGTLLLGIVAALWTVDCFAGLYLTFPPRGSGRGLAPNGRAYRWLKSWLVKTGSLFKLTFTWHRASGLWIWLLLLAIAWSAVGLNLPQVYDPAMAAVLGTPPRVYRRLPELATPLHEPPLKWRQALEVGRALMAVQARAGEFDVIAERRITYDPSRGLYRYQVRSTRDVMTRWGGTTVWFSGRDGQLAAFEAPTGQNASLTATSWLYALHFGAVGGLPYRIVLCVTGVLIAALSVSGVYLWWAKRRGRTRQRQRGLPNTNAAVPRVPSTEGA